MFPEIVKLKTIEILKNRYGNNLNINSFIPVFGGDINSSYKIISEKENFFIKINNAVKYPLMFEAEAKGLELIKLFSHFKIPEVITHFKVDDFACLVLEFINQGRKKRGFWEDFAEKLAELHYSSSEYFGLEYNNYIGSLSQSNKKHGRIFL